MSEQPPESSATLNPSKRGRRPGNSHHPVHDVFTYHETVNESHCNVSGCTGKIPGKHAGNLMSHLKAHHKDVHKTVEDENAAKVGSAPKRPKQQKTSVLNGVQMSPEALQLHSLRIITESGLSFKALDYGGLQAIFKALTDAMPAAERVTISSRTIPPKIHGIADRIRSKIMAEVEGKMVTLQVDGCSKNHRHFIGINVQFILNGKTVVRTLAVEELMLSSTAANLKTTIMMILCKFKIPVKNIIAFTSDNGANYILAGKLLSLEEAEESLDEVDIGGGDEEWPDADVELSQDETKIQSVRCAAHTLQLAVDDALKSEKHLKPTIDAVRKLATFMRNPNQVRQLKEAGLPLPKLDVCTRWGSTYDMLKSVFNLKNFMEMTLNWTIKDRAAYYLDEDQWKTVDGILDDLQPVHRATVNLQKENLTLGEFFAIWTELTMRLQEKESSLARRMLAAMEERTKSVQYKTKGRGEKLSPLFHYKSFNAAVFMDPRFFSLLTPDQIADAKAYLLDLWPRIQEARGIATEAVEDVDDLSESAASDLESDEDSSSGFKKLLAMKNRERLSAKQGTSSGRQSIRSASSRAKLREMLDEYDRTTDPLPNKTDVLTFWEKRRLITPELYELALTVLAIPATQVSVERLFSALRYILRPQRFGLTSTNIDDVVFLHANADLLQELANDLLQGPHGSQ